MADEKMDSINQRENLILGQQQNAATIGSKFKVLRFYLDNARTRYTYGVTDHTFGSGIKSFWVADTNNKYFIAKIVPNFRTDRTEGSGLPLRFNMNQKFTRPVDDACLEFPAQAGTWVDIAFSESEDIEIGSTDIALSGVVSLTEGSTFNQSKITVTSSSSLIIAANTSRKIARLQFKSGTSDVWIGSPTELADADYQNICMKIASGDDFEFRSNSSLYAKTDSGSTVFSLSEGLN